MLNLILIMLTASHFVACIWYFTARLENFHEKTWVYRLGLVGASNLE
jgi:hypothetical protein